MFIVSRSGRQSNLFKHNIIEDKKNGIAITSKRLAEDLQTRPSKKSRTENALQNSIDALDTSSQSSDSTSLSGISLSESFFIPPPITTYNSSFDENQVNNNCQPDSQAPVNNFSNYNFKQSDFYDLNTRYQINYNNYVFLQNNAYQNSYGNYNNNFNNYNYYFNSSANVNPIDTNSQLSDTDFNQLGQILTEFDFQISL
jgi:hypothetical protein